MALLNLYLKKLLLVFLSLQILNLSIYNTDCYTFDDLFPAMGQVSDANPIDSFAELIVEQVDGYENAFPEPAQKTEKQNGELKHNITFKLYYADRFTTLPEKPDLSLTPADIRLTGFCNNYSYLFAPEIIHPPA